jgi:hypothetical protein
LIFGRDDKKIKAKRKKMKGEEKGSSELNRIFVANTRPTTIKRTLCCFKYHREQ